MLCTMVLNDTLRTINAMPENVGSDFDILTISFNPADTPADARAKKQTYLSRYNRTGGDAGWHFLTGSPASIAAITSASGFRYVWDPKYQQFAHASGIMVLTPDGKISKYFYGIDYAPKDLRLALVEASGGKSADLPTPSSSTVSTTTPPQVSTASPSTAPSKPVESSPCSPSPHSSSS